MGFLGTLRHLTLSMVAIANLIVVIIMCATAYAGWVSPLQHPWLSLLSLAFPVPLIINLGFLFFWLITKRKYLWIPLLGMLLCFTAIRNYCPFNLPSEVPDESIKVLSYNVCRFMSDPENQTSDAKTAEYIKNSGADIVCLQESRPKEGQEESIMGILEKAYPYHVNTYMKAREQLDLFTRFPVKWTKNLSENWKGNVCVAYCLDIGDDSLLLVNCHLQSIGFDNSEKQGMKEMMAHPKENTGNRTLLRKISRAAVKRARQVTEVAAFLRQHEGMSMLLCGDFNDSPVSYPHHVIDDILTDCYRSSGNGLGFTYRRYGMYVRIDHIFCSDDWRSYQCKVDTKTTTSDHYPITCWIKKGQISKK